MQKIICYAPQLVQRAIRGDPVSIALLVIAGISIGWDALKKK